MTDHNESPLQTLSEIRQLMERSSRFISLSGLSGVFAGIYALIGAFVAYQYLGIDGVGYNSGQLITIENLRFIVIDAAMVLILAVSTGILLTTRKAAKDGNSIFDSTAKRLISNLCVPLTAGGLFCLALIYHNDFVYVPSVTLIFYGLALVHASSYTRNDIRSLGYVEIILGLISVFNFGYAFLFWIIGFGIMHIIYGTYMYFKYER